MARTAKGKYERWLEPDGLLLVSAWARDGLSDEQIAVDKMHIAYSTLRVWIDKFPALSAALKKGKEVVDIQVENSLYKRALGYEYTEEKVELETNKDDKVLSRKVTQTVKQVLPDITAQIFWLKNRKPDKWRDKQVQEIESTASNDTLQCLADLINKPVPNRSIEDADQDETHNSDGT